MSRLTFWFDPHSPWCLLAALRIGDLARRHDRPLDWTPIHLPRLIERIGGRRSLDENPAFVRWYRQDLADWAELAGIRISYHPRYPLRPGRAQRLCRLASDAGLGEPVAIRVLRAYWTEEADIEDVELLARLAAEAGFTRPYLADRLADPALRRRIEADTEAAIAASVFGVPTVAAAGKLFFGNDRLDLLDRWLDPASTWDAPRHP